MKRTHKIGTNQHRIKNKYRFKKSLTYLMIIIILVSAIGFVSQERVKELEARKNIISPLAMSAVVYVAPLPVEVKTSEQAQIVDYIKEVFGEHASQAFQVLGCENAKLNPNAVNTAGNTPKGSRDIGVFQINEYWQGVRGKFLFNPRVNIEIAYQIFKDNGNSFERWTCGRKLGV